MKRAALLAALLLGCATTPPAPARSLYDRLGGKPAISAVVHDFLGRVAADSRINGRFANTNLPRLESLLVDQICEATGGPCRYTGRDMKATHVGMGISVPDFDALVEDLKASLDQFRVPAREQHDLLGALASMKPDIVERRTHPAAAAQPGGPVGERAEGLREAATLLDKADAARTRGNRSLADQLFSSAELIVGAEPLAALAALFREGAPPRITTPPVAAPSNSAPQPVAVGSSADEEPEPRPQKGALAGAVRAAGGDDTLAVVTLEPLSGRFTRRAPRHRVIEQRNREFAPRLLAVPVGSTVSFPNFDSIYHNVFSRSDARPFDLGLYKSGQARELAFDREGIVRVGCNLHANMSATVVVVSAPHYAITDRRGHFLFRSLEPGRYRLRAYGERSAAPTIQEVTVVAGDNNVRVALGAESSGPLADKFGMARAGKDAR
jgi:hemoglobin